VRKRSKYKPKGTRLDVMTWIKEGMKPMTSHNDAVLALRIKNHSALTAVVQGKATRDDLDILIAAVNITEALALRGIGSDWHDEIRAAQDAVLTMTRRGLANGDKFLFTGPEMQAVNLAMEIHDAQIDQASVSDLERALDKVQEEIKGKRARAIQLEEA
jgi:hypothetical protein